MLFLSLEASTLRLSGFGMCMRMGVLVATSWGLLQRNRRLLVRVCLKLMMNLFRAHRQNSEKTKYSKKW